MHTITGSAHPPITKKSFFAPHASRSSSQSTASLFRQHLHGKLASIPLVQGWDGRPTAVKCTRSLIASSFASVENKKLLYGVGRLHNQCSRMATYPNPIIHLCTERAHTEKKNVSCVPLQALRQAFRHQTCKPFPHPSRQWIYASELTEASEINRAEMTIHPG